MSNYPDDISKYSNDTTNPQSPFYVEPVDYSEEKIEQVLLSIDNFNDALAHTEDSDIDELLACVLDVYHSISVVMSHGHYKPTDEAVEDLRDKMEEIARLYVEKTGRYMEDCNDRGNLPTE
jgi:hypothetical protein